MNRLDKSTPQIISFHANNQMYGAIKMTNCQSINVHDDLMIHSSVQTTYNE